MHFLPLSVVAASGNVAALSEVWITGYGYDWFIRKLRDNHALEHDGDIGRFSADTWRFPEEQIFISVLANSDCHDPSSDTIAKKTVASILHP